MENVHTKKSKALINKIYVVDCAASNAHVKEGTRSYGTEIKKGLELLNVTRQWYGIKWQINEQNKLIK